MIAHLFVGKGSNKSGRTDWHGLKIRCLNLLENTFAQSLIKELEPKCNLGCVCEFRKPRNPKLLNTGE